MVKTLKLVFVRPVGDDVPVNEKDGKFGAQRPYGTHIGVDFSAYFDTVYACEDGCVVYSGSRDGSENKANYGNIIVIDHTPDAKKDERHIYSLYAHLDNISTSKDKNVRKGEVIGTSGNTGTRQHYEGERNGISKSKQRGYHLHFEIIDSPKGFNFSGGWPGDLRPEDRKDPMKEYIGQTKILEYALTEREINKISASLDIEPVMDFERGVYRFDLYLDGKNIGFFDKQNNEVIADLTPGELEKILGSNA